MKINNYSKSNTSGFTIIETLVAITILMIAIAGPISFAQKSLTASIYARDQVTAFFYAQESMEQIKNQKSTNKLIGVNWLTRLLSGCSTSYYGLDSKFKRDTCITSSITNVDGSNNAVEATVTVTVSWANGTVLNSVFITSEIYNVAL